MKKIYFLLLAIGLISNISISQSKWYRTNGPTGGPIFSVFEKSSSKIFLGTNEGIYKSVNSGSQFSPIALYDKQIIQVIALNNRLFAVDGNYKLFRSSDDGTSWSDITASTGITGLFVFNGNLFAYTPWNGIYKSTNYGDNWTVLTNGIPANLDLLLASFGNYLYAFLNSNNIIYRSSDNGDSFSVLNNDLPAFDGVNSFGTFNNYLFVNLITTTGSMLYKSTNSGVNWTKINWDPLNYVNSFVQSGSYILASVNNKGVYRSSNIGQNWSLVNNGLSRLDGINLTKGASKIYASINYNFYTGALFQTTNAGTTWSELTNGLTTGDVFDMVLMNNNILAATPNGLYKSTNQGTSWAISNSGLTSSQVKVLYRKDNTSTVYAGTRDSGLYISNNFGASWKHTTFNIENVMSISISGAYIYVGTYFDGIYFSTDNGITWAENSLSVQRVPALASKGNYVYAGWRNTHGKPHGGISASSDRGLTWTDSDIPDAPVGAIGIFDNNDVIAVSNAVYHSTNFGINWSKLDTGITNTTPIVDPADLVVMGYGDVYVAYANGVAGSYDYGKTWELVSYGLLSTNCSVITGDMNLLLVSPPYFGVWKLPLAKNKSGFAMLTNGINSSPAENKLLQNMPNPFNPVTKIKYQISEPGNVSLKVYDITGKEVVTLMNGHLQTGVYEASFDGSKLSSGVYFYKLETENYTMTRRMILLK